jgi:hypothetical protein
VSADDDFYQHLKTRNLGACASVLGYLLLLLLKKVHDVAAESSEPVDSGRGL